MLFNQSCLSQVGFLNADVIPELSSYETDSWVRYKWDTIQVFCYVVDQDRLHKGEGYGGGAAGFQFPVRFLGFLIYLLDEYWFITAFTRFIHALSSALRLPPLCASPR